MSVEIQLVDRVTAQLKALPEKTRARLRVVIVRDGKELAQRVRRKLSGEVLHVRSGKLINSIHSEMVENQYSIYGRTYTANVPYDAIHEYGGVTRPHDIYPRNAAALHFFVDGKEIFARHVNHPGSKIPMRSYMRSSLDEMRAIMIADFLEAGRPQWS